MVLGNFIFELKTAAFGTMHKVHEYRWEVTDVVGNPPILQALGKGADKCDLEGVIYQAGSEAIENLKILAETQEPLLMVDGSGNIHGNWVIKQISETQSYFDKFGNPRKVEFKIALEKYSGEYESLFNVLRRLF
jgi:phage protein U